MDGIPLSQLTPAGLICFLVLVIAAMLYGLWKALMRGDIRTGREVQAMDRRMEAQAKMIEELTDQNRMLLGETIPTITSVLVALREAIGRRAS